MSLRAWPLLLALLAGGCLSIPAAPGDPGPRAWRTIDPDGAAVPGVTFGQMTYDVNRHLTYLYGGSVNTNDSGASAAMYAFDGTSWARVCDPCAPGDRARGHGFVFDLNRDRLLLFGGRDASGTIQSDMWQFKDDSWSRVPEGELPSPARSGSFTVYDSNTARLLVYGGETNDGATAGLLAFDGMAWSEADNFIAITPGPRISMSAAAIDQQGRMYVYGSTDFRGLDDLWRWDGSDWQQLCDQCTGSPRDSAALARDPATDNLLVINGFDGTELAGTVVLSADGTAIETLDEPSARDSLAVASDPSSRTVVMFGGNGYGCEMTGNICRDTLIYQDVDSN